MTVLEEEIARWHADLFGPDSAARVPATYRKLCEEVGELGEALMAGAEEGVRLEAGDVAIALLSLLRLATGDRTLRHVMQRAHAKNVRRLSASIVGAKADTAAENVPVGGRR